MSKFVKTPATAARETSPEAYSLDQISTTRPYLVFKSSDANMRHVHMRGNRPGTYGNTAVADAKSNFNNRKTTTDDMRLSANVLKAGHTIVYLRSQVNAVLRDHAF